MNTIMQKQQGDINIVEISEPDPKGYSFRQGGLIREGSTTSHSHRLEGGVFQVFNLGWSRIVAVVKETTQLVHEEHETIILEPGWYGFTPVFEFDHLTERSQLVLD